MKDYKYKEGDKVWYMEEGELVKCVVTFACRDGNYIIARALRALRHTGARTDELWPRGKKTIARLISEDRPESLDNHGESI